MQNYKFHHSIKVKELKLTKEVQYYLRNNNIELYVNFSTKYKTY